MPELPEVEITRLGLWSELSHQPILQQIIYYRKDLRWTLPKMAKKKIPGQKLIQIRRRAKYLVFEFANSILISHLGMSGSWRKVNPSEKLKKQLEDDQQLSINEKKKLVGRTHFFCKLFCHNKLP